MIIDISYKWEIKYHKSNRQNGQDMFRFNSCKKMSACYKPQNWKKKTHKQEKREVTIHVCVCVTINLGTIITLTSKANK
jgi:arylamine N-acetyltransferase